ncbi:MAG TPA: hypothetical protein VK996_06845, partial [Ramlibacter sp.]|nr:hypothetical protein [Ramlibacter sp.]
MASLDFTNAYQVDTTSTPAGKESNSHDIIFTSLGATAINDGSGGQTFNGNDVAVISIIIGGTTYFGWISRPVKSGGDVKGFYFWTDEDFTSLSVATADGNTDGDSDESDNLGFILVVDQAYFDSLPFESPNIKNVGSSSDGVDDDLNSLLPPLPPIVTITEDANNNGIINSLELSGNVNVSVALPPTAATGDVLSVTDGIATNSFTLTNAQITSGVVLTSFAPPAQGGTITVTATVSRDSVAGPSGNDSAVLDSVGPGAPTVTITEDTNNNGTISGSELSGDVNVSIALPAGAVAGDVLSVSDGLTTQTFTLTAGQISAGTVTTTFTPPAEGGTITVTAFVTDQNGNAGTSGNDSAVRDTVGPTAPTVTITEDTNNNGVISGSEFSGLANVSVALPAGAVAGDELSVSDGLTTQTFTLTGGQISAGVVTTTFAQPAEGGTITVTAFVTDQNGNVGASGSDLAVRDTAGPSAPTVTITEDANNDAVINGSELSGNVDVSVVLPGDAIAGDVLSVTDGLTTQNFTLTAGQISGGTVTTSFAPPAQGGTITVTAFVTDQNGNQGASDDDSALRDTAGPTAPTVTITEDANNNGVINATELSGDVNVSVALPAGAVAGDELTITDGVTPQVSTLTAGQIAAGVVTTTFAPPAQGATITVSAFVTDQNDNQGATGSDAAMLDTVGPGAPTVTITEDANNDAVINAAELSGDVNVSVALPGGAVAGDVLSVTDGLTTQTFTLTGAQILAGSVATTFTPPTQGATITVTAFVTDQNANQGASGSDFAVRDTGGPSAPTVTITEDANNNGVINIAELSGDVDVSVALPGAGVVAGDVLTVTDGLTTQTFTLTALQIAGGTVTTTFAPPAEGATITVSAFVTDQSSNEGGTGTDLAVRDTLAPSAPTVVITEDANNNAAISAPELNGDVDVSVTLPGGLVAGDVLRVSDGTTTRTFTLTALQIGAGVVTTTFTPPDPGATITVTAFVTDQNGNAGASGSDFAVRDALGPFATTVVITEDANNNGVINAAELSGAINVTVDFPSAAVAGDVVTVTDGLTTQNFTLTGAQISAGVITTTFAPPAQGAVITVTAFTTDQDSNEGTSGSDFALLDTVGPPAPAVVITEDANNDAVISAAELVGDVDVTVTLPVGAVAGDVLTVTDGLTPQTFTLTALQVAAGSIATTFTPPPEGGTITVTAFVTDQNSNVGGTGTDLAVRDTGGPVSPVVVITEDTNNNTVISASELSGAVDVTVSLPAGAVEGDVLTVTDGITPQAFTLTALQVAAGLVSTTFAPPAQGATITVTAFVTDQSANVGASGSDFAMLDTVGPPAPVVVITEDANNNAVISAAELSGNVDVSVTLPVGALAGDVLSVTDGLTTQTFTLTALQLAAGSVSTTFTPPAEGGVLTVTAFVTDQNGNQGSSGSDTALRDTVGPAAPTVVIVEDANNNGVISSSELSGNVDVSFTLPPGAVAGDVLTVTDGATTQTLTLTASHIAAGTGVTAFAAPAQGGSITVTAFLTDQNGNQGASGSDTALRDTVGPPAPSIVIIEDVNNDGVMSGSELSGAVEVRLTLNPGASPGDVITVTDGFTVQSLVLTAPIIAVGTGVTSFAAPPEGGSITVTTFLTDQNGNQGTSASDTALRDTLGPPAPNILILEDANNNGVISNSELSGAVDVRITLNPGAAPGDVLVVTDGFTTQSLVLTSPIIAIGTGTTTFAAPAP